MEAAGLGLPSDPDPVGGRQRQRWSTSAHAFYFPLPWLYQGKNRKHSKVTFPLFSTIHSWSDLFAYIFQGRNITQGKTDEVVLISLALWHNSHRHTLTSAIESYPETITLTKAPPLLVTFIVPSEHQTSQWFFNRRPLRSVDVQVLCDHEKSHCKHLRNFI